MLIFILFLLLNLFNFASPAPVSAIMTSSAGCSPDCPSGTVCCWPSARCAEPETSCRYFYQSRGFTNSAESALEMSATDSNKILPSLQASAEVEKLAANIETARDTSVGVTEDFDWLIRDTTAAQKEDFDWLIRDSTVAIPKEDFDWLIRDSNAATEEDAGWLIRDTATKNVQEAGWLIRRDTDIPTHKDFDWLIRDDAAMAKENFDWLIRDNAAVTNEDFDWLIRDVTAPESSE